MKKRKKTIFRNIIQWFIFFMIAIVLAVFLRVFLFDTFTIPSASMHPAIVSGDHVIVNKLVPGPRMIMNFFSLNKNNKPEIKRIRGLEIKRNDILIFNYPYSVQKQLTVDLNLYYAKRCIGIPGDTFYIENGFYRVKGIPDSLGNFKNQNTLSLRPDHQFTPEIFNCFPYDRFYNWNIKNFGPLYIPGRGDSVPLDTINIALYRNLIAYETAMSVTVKDGYVLIGDSVTSVYTFRKNYYFMAGDLVLDSKDSRYWGLLPEDHITGKVSFVWNTKDAKSGKKKWSRFLKKVE